MHITQGTFSYLPPFTDEQIRSQIEYALQNSWSLAIEHTDDPHPRNSYWDMWGQPLFDVADADAVLEELAACKAAQPEHYVKLRAYDRSLGRQTTAFDFIVQRPSEEPGFTLDRIEWSDRRQRYSIRSYATQQPRRPAREAHGP